MSSQPHNRRDKEEVAMYGADQAAVESAIARAHRALAGAIMNASTFSDLGLHDDLQLIQLELERLQVDLLKHRKPRRITLGNRA